MNKKSLIKSAAKRKKRPTKTKCVKPKLSAEGTEYSAQSQISLMTEDVKKNAVGFIERLKTRGIKGCREQYREAKNYNPDGEKTAFSKNDDFNRYPDVQLLDATRVILKEGGDTDYIHASRVVFGPSLFICTQGPLSETCAHFWQMIIQEKVTVIVMLCRNNENGKDKCAEYFPIKKDATMTFGAIKVICMESGPLETVEFARVTQLEVGKNKRQVYHVQYDGWPDHCSPDDTEAMFRLMKIVRDKAREKDPKEPIAVHCSAGVGRTGTYVAIEMARLQLQIGQLDGVTVLKKLRDQRLQSIQTELQYLFLIRAILEILIEKKIVPKEEPYVKEFCTEYEKLAKRKKTDIQNKIHNKKKGTLETEEK